MGDRTEAPGGNALLGIWTDHHASIDAHHPSGELISIVRRHIPAEWGLHRVSPWFSVAPPGLVDRPQQGWKIHLSAAVSDAPSALDAVARYCVAELIPFKFALDTSVVELMVSKGFSRAAAGKFITIYPTEDQFLIAGRTLAELTAHLDGPRILSDRLFPGSRIVHYRYGSFASISAVDGDGAQAAFLVDPQGRLVEERRVPYWEMPLWIDHDPVRGPRPPSVPPQAPSTHSSQLFDGRFRVDAALRFTNAGGIYTGTDTHDGSKVLIKEARPHVITGAGRTSVELLRREAAALERLASTGAAPELLDVRTQGTHTFVVQRYVEGHTFGQWTIANNPLIGGPSAPTGAVDYYRRLSAVIVAAGDAVERAHQAGVAHGDLSPLNLRVTETGSGPAVTLIDFEAGGPPGDAPEIYTWGYVSAERVEGRLAYADDWYSLVCLLACGVVISNGLARLDSSAPMRFFERAAATMPVPEEIVAVVRGVAIDPRASELSGDVIDPLRDYLSSTADVAGGAPTRPSPQQWACAAEPRDLDDAVVRIADYLEAHATPQRPQRLFPGDATGAGLPMSLSWAHGAAGVIVALDRVGRDTDRWWSWVLARDLSTLANPPGLGVGQAGVAVALASTGRCDEASQLAAAALAHHGARTSVSLHTGLAGLGMCALELFAATGDDRWLAEATSIVDEIAARCGVGCDDPDGIAELEGGRVGLLHGYTGVAAFHLFAGAALDDDRLIERAAQLLERDTATLRETGPGHWSTPRTRPSASSTPLVSPYLEDGSAGIVMVAARLHRLGVDDAAALVTRLYTDCAVPWTVLVGAYRGLVGLGAALIDSAALCSDAMDAAHGIAQSACDFLIERPEGLGVAGDQCEYLGSDVAYGAAGVLLFVQALRTGEPHRLVPFPDELLGART